MCKGRSPNARAQMIQYRCSRCLPRRKCFGAKSRQIRWKLYTSLEELEVDVFYSSKLHSKECEQQSVCLKSYRTFEGLSQKHEDLETRSPGNLAEIRTRHPELNASISQKKRTQQRMCYA